MMSILGTLFIGLIAGFIARAIKPGNDSMGWIMTALLGVAGADDATVGRHQHAADPGVGVGQGQRVPAGIQRGLQMDQVGVHPELSA